MTKVGTSRYGRHAAQVFSFALFFITGLAISRLLYEAAFPRLLGLARPFPVFLLSLLIAGVGWLCWRWAGKRMAGRSDRSTNVPFSVWALAPLLINLPYLFDPAVNLASSRLLFAACLWLSALFLARPLVQVQRWRWLGVIFILAALLPIYLITMPETVGSADTFEFQVVIPQMGIAHPTGYPLYLLLGRLFTFIPVGTVAWRVNLASAVFAILAAVLLFDLARRLLKRILPALLAAVFLGLTPVFWSQAIEAEVYALHAFFVAAALWLMVLMLNESAEGENCSADLLERPVRMDWRRLVVTLAFVIGLGLANHLTTLFLLPPAILTVTLAYGSCLRSYSARANLILLLKTLAAFLLPLLLYVYLPIRWFALHGQPMGFGRFAQWVIGGRFQGALQLTAWLNDMTRYQVIGRLLLQNWGWVNLALIVIGLVYLIKLNWRVALVLFIAWLGFTFYALNYYVPDLAVFIIPSHVMMALFWGAGVTAVLVGSGWLLRQEQYSSLRAPIYNIALLLLLLPSLFRMSASWSEMQGNKNNHLLTWGKAVLALPLDMGAAILADSEKIAPLYYLQQAEGERPDLDIMVLPDEAAYRAELDARIAAGQTVYLARFLPGLEGVYHLRSVGPLIEVSKDPMMTLPKEVERSQLGFGPLQMIGVALQEMVAVDPDTAAVTLFWRAEAPLTEPHFVYLRWAGADFATDPLVKSGQHPAANTYPTVAWQPGEIVPDFHLLPRPLSDQEQELELQVAIGPSFTPPEELAWHTVKNVTNSAAQERELGQSLRAQNGRVLLSGVQFPVEIRPQTPLPLILTGYGNHVRDLQFSLQPIGMELDNVTNQALLATAGTGQPPFAYATQVDTDVPNGRYYLLSQDPQAASICSWLTVKTNGCILGEVTISGVPLPEGATNYEDKIALLEVDLPQEHLQPGGQLPISLRWQSLSPMDEDYTLFIQVLNAQDQIVGQVDSWPIQGTYPTSQWKPGEIVDDPYLVQLATDLPPGQYRLQIGWYLLSTLRRLPVLDEDGLSLDDKMTIEDLVVP
jgi:4-amino-4-deoxy-L-arabinose transferase-like glycosyltransferase